MRYAIATVGAVADIIRLIVTGTVTRAALILVLIASDVWFWLIVLALFVAQIC